MICFTSKFILQWNLAWDIRDLENYLYAYDFLNGAKLTLEPEATMPYDKLKKTFIIIKSLFFIIKLKFNFIARCEIAIKMCAFWWVLSTFLPNCFKKWIIIFNVIVKFEIKIIYRLMLLRTQMLFGPNEATTCLDCCYYPQTNGSHWPMGWKIIIFILSFFECGPTINYKIKT